MLFDVYNLGTGEWDPVDVLRAGPTQGHLKVRRRYPASHDTSVVATLLNPAGKELMGPLLHVQLCAMNSTSLLLEGTVVIAERQTLKSKANRYTVRWLCKVPGTPAVLNTTAVQQRHAKLMKELSVNGFHPAYDDVADLQSTYGPLDV